MREIFQLQFLFSIQSSFFCTHRIVCQRKVSFFPLLIRLKVGLVPHRRYLLCEQLHFLRYQQNYRANSFFFLAGNEIEKEVTENRCCSQHTSKGAIRTHPTDNQFYLIKIFKFILRFLSLGFFCLFAIFCSTTIDSVEKCFFLSPLAHI